MTRVKLTAVEHGLALLVAMGLADVASAAFVVALVPGITVSRGTLVWVVADAIPLAVAVALLARTRSRPHELALRAIVLALGVEIVAFASIFAVEAPEASRLTARLSLAVLAHGLLASIYGTAAGALVALAGRAASLALATRLRGTILEGAALGFPQALSWLYVIHVRDSAAESAESGGALVFALASLVVLPLVERATALAFARLGITSDAAASSADP